MILNDLKTKENFIKKEVWNPDGIKEVFWSPCGQGWIWWRKNDIFENEYEKYEKEKISFAELIAKLEPSSNSKKDSRKESKPLEVIKL